MSELYDVFSRGNGGVATDSRKVAPGDIFFALRGEKFDGNLYAGTALQAGAAMAVVDERFAASDEGGAVEDDPRYIVVPDTLKALQGLAAMYRRKLGIPIIALTGSNGKTTTKELMSGVLGVKFNVKATRGNLNNHIGVPLTLLSFGKDTEIGIVEMGANHFGEISELCDIARPEFGMITNIGKAHLEGFANLRGVRKAKGELFDYLADTGGRAFYSEDDPVIEEMVHWRPALDAEPYSFESLGIGELPSEGGTIAIMVDGERLKTQLVGRYNIHNIAAAIAVGRYFDVDRAGMLAALASYRPDNNRSQQAFTGRNTLYMDAYNANPSSMAAALENFSSLDVPDKMLILGDMLELGDSSREEHAAIVGMIKGLGFGRVFLAGPDFADAAAGSGLAAFADTDGLIAHLKKEPVSGAHILIKGSRGMGLEKVAGVL